MGRSKRGGQKAAGVDDDDTDDILVTGYDGGGNGGEDAKTLAADVAAMQAQLGLGGGGGGIGFDDRDFRPQPKKDVTVAAKVGATALRPARSRPTFDGWSEPRELCSVGAAHQSDPAHDHVVLSIASSDRSTARIVRHPTTEMEGLLLRGWAGRLCAGRQGQEGSQEG